VIVSLPVSSPHPGTGPYHPASPQAQWDAELDALGGSLLQSWRWGAVKASCGWEVERIRVEVGGKIGLAQLLIRRYGPFGFAYLPRGPVVENDETVVTALFDAIDRTCAQHHVITLVVEPDAPVFPGGECDDLGFMPGPQPVQPERTVRVPILDDDDILAQMRRDTRANLRRAERHGVVTERAAPSATSIDRFYRLLSETSTRNAFGVHTREYYADVLHRFGDDALLAFARVDAGDAIGLIALRQGTEAVYLYGCSSTSRRIRGASVLLQYEAMRWARERGCTCYDLWGIPAANPPARDLACGQVQPARGNRLDGLYQFKTGFGGGIVSYPPPIERRYHPFLAWITRHSSRYRTT